MANEFIPGGKLDLSGLKEYLLAHELDIAWGINDFEGLKGTFLGIIGREPRGDA